MYENAEPCIMAQYTQFHSIVQHNVQWIDNHNFGLGIKTKDSVSCLNIASRWADYKFFPPEACRDIGPPKLVLEIVHILFSARLHLHAIEANHLFSLCIGILNLAIMK